MRASTSGPDLFNLLADEFAARYRRGERPPLSEYTDKYPELADEIRELFPALVAIEQFGSGAEAAAKRYYRAVKRLKEVLASMPGGYEGI